MDMIIFRIFEARSWVFVCAVCASLFFALFLPVYASPILDIQAEIEKKNTEIKKLEEEAEAFKKNIDTTQRQSRTLLNQIAGIDQNIRKVASDIRLTEVKIERVNLEIDILGERTFIKEEEISRQKTGLEEVLRVLYERDRENYIASLIKYASISSFLNRVNEFVVLQNSFVEHLSKLKSLKSELDETMRAAEEKRRDLAFLKDGLSDKKVLQELEKNEKSRILRTTKNQEKAYQSLLTQTEKREREVLEELEGLEEKLRILIDPASLPPKRNDFFSWPADGRLTQGYGKTAFAIRSDFYSFHNGIDIANSYGTPVYAAYPGIVAYVGNTDNFCPGGAYGRYVLIDHENNLSTFYSHFSLSKVKKGDRVEEGRLLGYMGRSGLTTGSHLHFTVYDYRTVEVKESRICGPMPYGGSIDPMDYL